MDQCSDGGGDPADVHALAAVHRDELVVVGGDLPQRELLVRAAVAGPLVDRRAVGGGDAADVEALAAVAVHQGVGVRHPWHRAEVEPLFLTGAAGVLPVLSAVGGALVGVVQAVPAVLGDGG